MGDFIKIIGSLVLVFAANYAWEHFDSIKSIKLTDLLLWYLIGDVVLMIVLIVMFNALVDTMEPFDPPAMVVVGPMLVLLVLWLFCVVMTIVILPRYIYENSAEIAAAMTPRVVIVPAIGLSAFLYWLRGRLPLIYGSLEIFVGMLSLSITTQGHVADLLTKLIGVSGGVYIIIRGLDNVDKGIPGGWRKVFNKLRGITTSAEDE
jgi:hypothetical protein